MRRTLTLLLLSLLPAAACWAGVDANQATEAELDGIRGIGPGLSSRILQARQKTPFHDWSDFISRVGGVGKTTAARISAEGLTVNGEHYPAASTERAAKVRATPASTAHQPTETPQ